MCSQVRYECRPSDGNMRGIYEWNNEKEME